MEEAVHVPVMPAEVREFLAFEGPGWIVDGTLGLAGHAAILLEASPQANLLGMDRDPEALKIAESRLSKYANRVKLVRENFAELPRVMAELNIKEARSILLDLGVSSFQLTSSHRGFSFSRPGPLDMRMDTTSGETLEEILNWINETELARAIWEFGEERRSRAIARRILTDFRAGQITDTAQLAATITKACGPRRRSEKIHPATRTMQALRILVNHELDALESLLVSTRELLGIGGRIAVITFHSLEDRIVKRWFANQAAVCVCPIELPVCRCGSSPRMRLLSRGVKPSEEEIDKNPRARSARLRTGERLR